jgi:hypothetical protein
MQTQRQQPSITKSGRQANIGMSIRQKEGGSRERKQRKRTQRRQLSIAKSGAKDRIGEHERERERQRER